MTTQQPLANAFDARKAFFAHRASAVYPLRIRPHSDLCVVFMNYWLLKNDIPQVGVNFRAYDSHGSLRARRSLDAVALHNELSVREYLLRPSGAELPFDGMLEVEIVSTSNLAFPFPAILGVYEANGFFSAVHAAGRIKNPDEPKNPQRSEEANWTCVFERDGAGYSVVPFFHYFVGATPVPVGEAIEVRLRDRAGVVVDSKTLAIGGMLPFASRVFFADEIFALAQTPAEGSFMSVALRGYDVFPRLVVGNFHRTSDFLEVTHSFPISEFADYCPQPGPSAPANSVPSLLAAQVARGLQLSVRVFPTNCAGRVQTLVNRKAFDDKRLRAVGERFEFDSGVESDGLSFELGPEEELRVLHLHGDAIPSRLNASYRYRVAGVPRRFSTDIATGAKSIVYPPKRRHWGHGRVGGGFDTYVLFRNNTHSPDSTAAKTGEIRILGGGIDRVTRFDVAAESCVALRLSEVLEIDPAVRSPTFVSWLMSMANPVGETFWVAFRPDGAVFGEHGF